MSYVNPPLVSEREKGTDEDCAPCSALMLVLAHWPGRAPATLAEAERLRAAAGYGPEGGTSVEGIARGMTKRYGPRMTPRIAKYFSALWSLLKPGYGAFVIIKPDRFPLSHPFRIWNANYHGLHCVYVGRKGWRRRVWMIDPEGPRGGSYTGAWVSKSDLAKAFVGSAGVLSIHKR
jgi:hypothetical protein